MRGRIAAAVIVYTTELGLRDHLVKVHRRGVRYVMVGAAHEFTRDNVRAAEVVALAPELKGHAG